MDSHPIVSINSLPENKNKATRNAGFALLEFAICLSHFLLHAGI